MASKIRWLISEGLISKDNSVKNLSEKYLQKARTNLITMSLLSEVNTNKKIREILKISPNYDSDEWIVICGYYAMYSAALSLISKIGYKSKNHAATLALLEEFYIKKKILEKETLNIIQNAAISKEEIEKLSEAKHKREIAQYSVTKKTTKEIAEQIKRDAYNFINVVELIL